VTTFRIIERARRKAEREHDLNGGEWCAVQLDNGTIVVRCKDKAERMARKGRGKIVARVPEVAP